MKALITLATLALIAASGPTLTHAQTPGLNLANAGYTANDPAAAARAFQAALTAGGLSDAQARGVRLALSDVLSQTGDTSGRVAALAPLATEMSYAVQSRLAYGLDAAKRPAEAATAYAAAAGDAPTPQARIDMLRGRIFALSSLSQAAETMATVQTLATEQVLSRDDAINLAYISVKFSDDRLAQGFFARADTLQPLAGDLALDAAYSAQRVKDRDTTVRYPKRSLDGAATGDPSRRYQVRRGLADLSRRAGATASLFYDDTGSQTGRVPGAGSGNLQAGTEAYLRPLGYNNGRPVEVFVRAFETLDSRLGDPTGSETVQGWIGARIKPFASQNLIVEGSRLVSIGDRALDDWMVRAAWSSTSGLDLRPGSTATRMHQVYVDVAHLTDAGATFAVVDGRIGRSYQPGGGNLILAPFVGATLSYDSGLEREAALSAGPGVWLRLWIREDRYRAPLSYIDVALQYRVRLAGDRRAEGLFGNLSFAY